MLQVNASNNKSKGTPEIEIPARRQSSLKPRDSEIRTVFANDAAANSAFKFLVSFTKLWHLFCKVSGPFAMPYLLGVSILLSMLYANTMGKVESCPFPELVQA